MRKVMLAVVLLMLLISGCSGAPADLKKSTKSPVVSDQAVNENNQKAKTEEIQTPTAPSTSLSDESKQLLQATIVRNIDGDTVVINVNGKEETVRMLCVDTPETHHPRLGVQPFGPEAAAFTQKTLFPGKKVEVELGIGGGRDKYGRLLAYIYVDGKMFNEVLLEQGLARVAYVYAPNTKYVDQFYAFQKVAQQKGIGIWSLENYAKDDGFHPNAPGESNQSSVTPGQLGGNYQNNPNDDQEANLNCKGKIKGNANSHIYHVPGGAFYDTVKDNIVWFCTEKEAIAAGYHKSKR